MEIRASEKRSYLQSGIRQIVVARFKDMVTCSMLFVWRGFSRP